MNNTILLNVCIDVCSGRFSALKLDLYSEKLILPHLLVYHLPCYRVFFHLFTLYYVCSEHSDEIFHQVSITVDFGVSESSTGRLALLFADLNGVKTFVQTLAV